MARGTASPRSDNINIRVTPETLGLIDRSARAVGKTRTAFIVETMRTAAEDALLDQRLLVVDAETWEAFTSALDALMTRKPPWET